jgi:hypothetical protein
MIETTGHTIAISPGVGRAGGRARPPALGVQSANNVATKEEESDHPTGSIMRRPAWAAGNGQDSSSRPAR